MRINLEKLEAQGFSANINEEERTIDIWPTNVSEKLTRELTKVATRLGLNERNTDILIGYTMDLQVIQAIAS